MNIKSILANATVIPDEPVSEVCPQCGGSGFFRRDVPLDDPDFGKVVPCDNPIHVKNKADYWAQLSQLSPAQLSVTLNKIDVYHRKATVADASSFSELNGLQTPESIEKMITELGLYASNKNALNAAKAFLGCHSRNSHNNGLNAPFKCPRGWFYVYGTNGNAKSVMLQALYNALRDEYSMHGLLVSMPRLVNLVREAYTERQDRESAEPGKFTPRGKEGRIDAIANLPVLAIDEFDFGDSKAVAISFALEVLQDILNRRYDKACDGTHITLFASNSDPATFPALIVERITDGRFWVVRNTAPSKRPFMKWPDE